jgi:hypothetical protein
MSAEIHLTKPLPKGCLNACIDMSKKNNIKTHPLLSAGDERFLSK